MAFSADELRVLRRALAEALQHTPTGPALHRPAPVVPAPARERGAGRQEYLRLAEALDEAAGESARLRTFLLADLARYRDALPGAAADYLERLARALDGGYRPAPEDLTALRDLDRLPCGPAESYRRACLRRRCEGLAPDGVRDRSEVRAPGTGRLLALPGGRTGPCEGPVSGSATPAGAEPVPVPGPPPGPEPDRRVPTPAELWPPRPQESPGGPEQRATG